MQEINRPSNIKSQSYQELSREWMLPRIVQNLTHRPIFHELGNHVYFALVLRNPQKQHYIRMSELYKN